VIGLQAGLGTFLEGQNFSLCHNIQTGSRARVLSTERDVKNVRSYTPTATPDMFAWYGAYLRPMNNSDIFMPPK
jgi:hypothetical protein